MTKTKTKTKTVTVSEVIDGDTFITDEKQTVRVANADAPEKGKHGAAKARNYLKNQIEGEKVVLRPVARDKYGRVVAHVYKDSKSIGKKLRKKGWR